MTIAQQSVAIRSTFQRLNDSFIEYITFPRQFGKIAYIRYEENKEHWQSPEKAIFHKDESLKHEQELRLTFFLNQRVPEGKAGRDCPVDLTRLIEKVIVSPYSEPWFFDVVRTLVTQHGLSADLVQKSRLSTMPQCIWPRPPQPSS